VTKTSMKPRFWEGLDGCHHIGDAELGLEAADRNRSSPGAAQACTTTRRLGPAKHGIMRGGILRSRKPSNDEKGVGSSHPVLAPPFVRVPRSDIPGDPNPKRQPLVWRHTGLSDSFHPGWQLARVLSATLRESRSPQTRCTPWRLTANDLIKAIMMCYSCAAGARHPQLRDLGAPAHERPRNGSS